MKYLLLLALLPLSVQAVPINYTFDGTVTSEYRKGEQYTGALTYDPDTHNSEHHYGGITFYRLVFSDFTVSGDVLGMSDNAGISNTYKGVSRATFYDEYNEIEFALEAPLPVVTTPLNLDEYRGIDVYFKHHPFATLDNFQQVPEPGWLFALGLLALGVRKCLTT